MRWPLDWLRTKKEDQEAATRIVSWKPKPTTSGAVTPCSIYWQGRVYIRSTDDSKLLDSTISDTLRNLKNHWRILCRGLCGASSTYLKFERVLGARTASAGYLHRNSSWCNDTVPCEVVANYKMPVDGRTIDEFWSSAPILWLYPFFSFSCKPNRICHSNWRLAVCSCCELAN